MVCFQLEVGSMSFSILVETQDGQIAASLAGLAARSRAVGVPPRLAGASVYRSVTASLEDPRWPVKANVRRAQ